MLLCVAVRAQEFALVYLLPHLRGAVGSDQGDEMVEWVAAEMMKVQRAEARCRSRSGRRSLRVVNQAPLELLTLARDSLDSASSASVASSGLRRLVDKRRGTVRLADSLLVRQSFHARYTSSLVRHSPGLV